MCRTVLFLATVLLASTASGSATPAVPSVPADSAAAASRAPDDTKDDTKKDIYHPPWHDDSRDTPRQDEKAVEILKKGIEALGGADAILGRKTIYISRKVINHQYPELMEGTITVWYKRPDKLRKEVVYPNRRHTDVLNGQQAWVDTGSGPQILGPAVTAGMADGLQELDLPVNYLDAELTYFNISQEIPGKLAHVVKVQKNGYTRELMFDVDTFLLEVSGEYENPWGATDRMKKFDRYRPVDGVMIPYHVEHWQANQLVIETDITDVKFNEPIDDSLFEYPDRNARHSPTP